MHANLYPEFYPDGLILSDRVKFIRLTKFIRFNFIRLLISSSRLSGSTFIRLNVYPKTPFRQCLSGWLNFIITFPFIRLNVYPVQRLSGNTFPAVFIRLVKVYPEMWICGRFPTPGRLGKSAKVFSSACTRRIRKSLFLTPGACK